MNYFAILKTLSYFVDIKDMERRSNAILKKIKNLYLLAAHYSRDLSQGLETDT